MMPVRIVVTITLLTLLPLAASACAGNGGDEQVTVFAAASLADVFDEMADEFERANPGTEVRLNTGGSSGLREQILDGAPAGVFASASADVMAEVAEGGLLEDDAQVFAGNQLVLAVAEDSRDLAIDGLDDLERQELTIGLCAEQVPCGRYASEALGQAGVTAAVDSREPNARALLAKLSDGELDAALVYASDVDASVAVRSVATADGVAIEYFVGVIAEHASPGARAFVDFVLSPAGQDILTDHGFVGV